MHSDKDSNGRLRPFCRTLYQSGPPMEACTPMEQPTDMQREHRKRDFHKVEVV